MYHGITVDAVVFDVAAAHRCNRTAEIALLRQYVVELQRHGEGTASKKSLRQLRVPHQFVGIHRVVAVSPSAVLVQVGGY